MDLVERIGTQSSETQAAVTRPLRSSVTESPTVTDPIAVVGMSCRFPGALDTTAFWELLYRDGDAVTEIPQDRWGTVSMFDTNPTVSGHMTTRWAGLLPNIDGFDAEFFGISPREAVHMDPQQRIFLEVACEALEYAGLTRSRLAGSSTGVFVGVHSLSCDYYLRQAANPLQMDAYTSTGAEHSIIASRLSYLRDLHGPSLTVDTACSSSLVAVHLACQSLRTRESEAAVVGGVNLIISPETMLAFSKLQVMASDGRCKTFDHRADGFVRGEGCGVVVLRRLSDALQDGDPVLAVIQGSAVNQDGTTNGLTAPNALSQRAVVRQALTGAGVDPMHVGYVETHGTGTPLGDPIEVEALANEVGREDSPFQCYLGALKTNIGHLEGAAGIAGLIKTVLCLCERFIPSNLHFEKLNPHITLAGTRLAIPMKGCAWDVPQGIKRVAGVSSFGFGGTNAHVVLEEASPE